MRGTGGTRPVRSAPRAPQFPDGKRPVVAKRPGLTSAWALMKNAGPGAGVLSATSAAHVLVAGARFELATFGL
jgi:hypothetical protein